jgi:hypothetical protein
MGCYMATWNAATGCQYTGYGSKMVVNAWISTLSASFGKQNVHKGLQCPIQSFAGVPGLYYIKVCLPLNDLSVLSLQTRLEESSILSKLAHAVTRTMASRERGLPDWSNVNSHLVILVQWQARTRVLKSGPSARVYQCPNGLHLV